MSEPGADVPGDRLRFALALAMAGVSCLLITGMAVAADRGTDQRGDVARPGLDILAVTTTFTDTDLKIDVELAGTWITDESRMLLSFGDQPGACWIWKFDYAVLLEDTGTAILTPDAPREEEVRPVASAIDGPHVTFTIPLDFLGNPLTLYYTVFAEYAVYDEMSTPVADLFPDDPGFPPEVTCREVAVMDDAPAPSSPPPAPALATADGSGPWLTFLPVTLLCAIAGLFAYDWLFAERRWLRTSARRSARSR